jgi:hypothetical protein
VTAVLVAYGWDGFGIADQIWASLLVAIGIVLALGMVRVRGDIYYALVVVWALLGILLKRTADGAVAAPAVVVSAVVGIVLVSAVIVLQVARGTVYQKS